MLRGSSLPGFAQERHALFGFVGVAQLASLGEQGRGLRGILTVGNDQLLEFGQLGVFGELGHGGAERSERPIVISGVEIALDFFDGAVAGGLAGLLVAAILQAIDLKAESRITAVDGLDDLPLVEGFTKLARSS